MPARPLIRRPAASALIVLLALLVAAVAAGLGLSSHTSAAVDTPNITIAGPGAPVLVGSSFSVQVSADSGEAVVEGYQVEIDVPAGLSFISGAHEATGAFPRCSPWAQNGLQPAWYAAGCGHSPPDSAFVGLAETVTLRCDTDGTFPLNLVDPGEDPNGGSTLSDQYGPVPTNLTPDGQETVGCYAAPTDTPTPTATPLAVGGIAEMPPLAGSSARRAAAPAEGSGWSAGSFAVLAAVGVAAAALVGVFGWYARRRWLR
jgi:hypothetical protein